jgi:galactose mutarotase-like enzyme
MSVSRLIVLEEGGSRALIYPEQGFQLHGFDVDLGRGSPLQLVYGPRGAREPADRRYGNPVLFPSVGLSHGSAPNSWEHGGRALLMQQHGWARDLYWHVEHLDGRSITGVLSPTSGVKAAFPFDFELRLRYVLEGRALTLETTIANQGNEPFPYALGFHPYLRAPLAGGRREDCRVQLPAGVRLQSPDNWRTLNRGPASARTVDLTEPELPGSIVLVETGAKALEVEDRAAGLAGRISVEESEESFPVWVVWSAAPEAPYVCLEPWTDAPNALNRPGTRTLAAGGTHRYRMTISVRAL